MGVGRNIRTRKSSTPYSVVGWDIAAQSATPPPRRAPPLATSFSTRSSCLQTRVDAKLNNAPLLGD